MADPFADFVKKQVVEKPPESLKPSFKERAILVHHYLVVHKWYKLVAEGYGIGMLGYMQYLNTFRPEHESYFWYVIDVIFWIRQVL